MRLSMEGEKRLKQTLFETLRSQVTQASEAYIEGNLHGIQQIGHSLRGNSGAAYFNLTRVAEIGAYFHRIQEWDEVTFSAMLLELQEIVLQLENELEIKD